MNKEQKKFHQDAQKMMNEVANEMMSVDNVKARLRVLLADRKKCVELQKDILAFAWLLEEAGDSDGASTCSRSAAIITNSTAMSGVVLEDLEKEINEKIPLRGGNPSSN